MLERIKEFGKYTAITGFRSVRTMDTEKFLEKTIGDKLTDAEIQLFDARLVATWEHLYFAALNALTAFRNKENISKSLAMETLLYASAQPQIRKATELIGIKPSSDIAVLVISSKKQNLGRALKTISDELGEKTDESVLEITDEKIRAIQEGFKISISEIGAIKRDNALKRAMTDLVVERVALLATRR